MTEDKHELPKYTQRGNEKYMLNNKKCLQTKFERVYTKFREALHERDLHFSEEA